MNTPATPQQDNKPNAAKPETAKTETPVTPVVTTSPASGQTAPVAKQEPKKAEAKPAAKKSPAKKSATKQSVAKKAPAEKTAAVKKTTAKRTSTTKKSPTKKATVKKTTVKKSDPVKTTVAKKSPVSKTVAQKPSTKQATSSMNMNAMFFAPKQSFNKDNIEMVLKSGAMLSKSFEDIGKLMMDNAKKQLDESLNVGQKMMSCKTLDDFTRLQKAYIESTMQRAMNQGKQISQISSNVSAQAPIMPLQEAFTTMLQSLLKK